MQHLTVVNHPLVQHKLTLMREKETSTAVFRQLLREISQFLAYEVTRELPMTTRRIETPLEPMDAPVLAGRKLALISILRAGNGLLDGMLELIPSARVGFVGLYRDEETLKPVQYYFKVPDELGERIVQLLRGSSAGLRVPRGQRDADAGSEAHQARARQRDDVGRRVEAGNRRHSSDDDACLDARRAPQIRSR